VHGSGTLAALPAASASNNGFLYYATDDSGGSLYRSNGSSWSKVAASVQGSAPTPSSITIVAGDGSPSVDDTRWSNMPNAVTEFLGQARHRTKIDLSNANEARIEVNVANPDAVPATAEFRLQYSTDQTTWNYLDGATGPGTAINTTGLHVSPYISIVNGAKADVYIRLVGINGNGRDPEFGKVDLQVR